VPYRDMVLFLRKCTELKQKGLLRDAKRPRSRIAGGEGAKFEH
jgi:hypothetical protein